MTASFRGSPEVSPFGSGAIGARAAHRGLIARFPSLLPISFGKRRFNGVGSERLLWQR